MRAAILRSFVIPAAAIALAAATVVAADQADQKHSSNRAGAVPARAVTPGQLKKFHITASEGRIAPNVVRVRKGESVQIVFVSKDGNYGIKIKEFNVSAKATPEKPAVVSFVADRIGTFEFRCARSWNMKKWSSNGTLVVD